MRVCGRLRFRARTASVRAMEVPDPDSLVQEQIAYYRARAPEYDDWWLRTGRYDSGDEFSALVPSD